MVSRDAVGLYVLLLAHAASLLGNVVAAIAIPWFVLESTGSPARMGVAAFFAATPLALGAFFGGAVADRIGPKRASVVGDVLSAGAIAAIPLLLAADLLAFWHILALSFLGSLFDGPSQAARQALVPELAARASMPLERANALHKGTEHLGYVAGAPLGGALIAGVGPSNALWVDAGSFVAAAVIVGVAVRPAARPARPRAPYLRDVLDGLAFIAREPLVRAFLVLPMVGNFFISPLALIVLPVYAREELGGAGAFAALMGAYGAGGLLGVAFFGVLGHRLRRRTVYVALAFVYPAVSFALVPLPGLVPALIVLASIGVVAGAGTPLYQTVRQEVTPAVLRARVFATTAAGEALVVPFAVLFAGYVVGALGLFAAVVVFALGNTAYGALKLTIPGTRDLDRGAAATQPPPFAPAPGGAAPEK